MIFGKLNFLSEHSETGAVATRLRGMSRPRGSLAESALPLGLHRWHRGRKLSRTCRIDIFGRREAEEGHESA